MRRPIKLTAIQAAFSLLLIMLGVILIVRSPGKSVPQGLSLDEALGIVMIVYGIARIWLLKRFEDKK